MIHVACAIILQGDKYLICQRSDKMKLPLKWEFPGGKVEEGESLEDCLIREVQEELDITITINRQLEIVVHHYEDFKVTLYPFICTIKDGFISLKEHAQYKWVLKNEISQYDLAAADVPIIKFI